jgi:hypothetical protein
VGVAGFVSLAGSAWAQDYSVTTATGQLETRPGGAVALNQTNSGTSTGLQVDIGFTVPWYGRELTRVLITPSGYLLPNPSGVANFLNPNTNGNAPGRDSTSGAFPYSPQGVNGTNTPNADGILTPMWNSNTAMYSGVPPVGDTYYWTTGTAPNRHFVVSWENFRAGLTTNPRITAQIHLYEGTGRIVFAYTTDNGGYAGTAYVCGIDSYGDARYTAPLGATRNNAGYPGSDFILDPRVVTYTGTLNYDRIVSDASGIGNSVQSNQPLAGLRVELRRDSGILVSDAITDSTGAFSMPAVGVASASSGSVVVLATGAAASVVLAPATAPAEWSATSNLSYASGSNLGTWTLGASADSTGATRACYFAAIKLAAVRDWVNSSIGVSLPRLDCRIDSSGSAVSRYRPDAGQGSPLLEIAGPSNVNPDQWDEDVIVHLYARHLLRAITALPSTPDDYRFDAVTDTQNAFAEGFGWYLNAATSGSTEAIDGTSASDATVYDLDAPTITVQRGADVAGCVAGGLVDLLDPANDSIDPIDGTAVPARVMQVVDTFTVPPTASAFLQAWVDAGYEAPGVTRIYIGNGLLADDTVEPNDARTEAPSLGTVGLKRTGLVLNRFNEDWFSVTLADAATALVADATYDRVSLNSVVGVEIRDAGGALLATGSGVGATGPIRATTGSLPAGSYRVGVRHLSGVTVPSYTVQSYVPLVIDAVPLTDWTIGRDYDHAMGVGGGIEPYTLTAIGASLPPGLALSQLNLHTIGTPTTPGTYSVSIELRDDGNPANVVTRSQGVTIHDLLKVAVARYVGFPAGRGLDLDLPTTGGTPPFTLSMPAGALPEGLAFAPNSLHVTGTASAQPSVTLELDGVDVAGSADHIATRAVVAAATDVANAPTELVAGDDACGWWFDAVKGSAVSFKVKTAKGRVKRLLTGAVLAPDRSEVLTAKVKGKLGGLSVSKLMCPESGRYYVIAASADGEATQLLGNIAVNPPKSGKAKLIDFAPTATTTVEVGALPGATLTLKFKGDKMQQLTAKLVSLTKPDGTLVAFGPYVVNDGFGGTLTVPTAEGGTWTVVLGATSATGNAGKLSYSYKLAQPKGGTYSAD